MISHVISLLLTGSRASLKLETGTKDAFSDSQCRPGSSAHVSHMSNKHSDTI